jgi:hypothetical protein
MLRQETKWMNEVAPIKRHPALPLRRFSLLEFGYFLCSAFVSAFDIRISDFPLLQPLFRISDYRISDFP